MKVVVLDYGFGNVRSAVRALRRAGAEAELTADPVAVLEADGLVVPGVGAFRAVMEGLKRVRAPQLIERRLAGGRGVLGICVGLQVMFERGEEHGFVTEGLGQWQGAVTRLRAEVVPHMGWSPVVAPAETTLFRGVESERFYFVHSYAAQEFTLSAGAGPPAGTFVPPLVAWAEHGAPFVAAVENGPLCATQFHPEKSGDAGAHLLENWIRTL
ncbi:MAG: imidazole glycerol phosphate synthase subunit HisH [Bifidobacteriaceae bacterium]|jgi:glutamine amidotransferase|nr:imidazole glycerol phosphate synthase subunit HisH [Bifidobacteriaceae bacterium]